MSQNTQQLFHKNSRHCNMINGYFVYFNYWTACWMPPSLCYVKVSLLRSFGFGSPPLVYSLNTADLQFLVLLATLKCCQTTELFDANGRNHIPARLTTCCHFNQPEMGQYRVRCHIYAPPIVPGVPSSSKLPKLLRVALSSWCSWTCSETRGHCLKSLCGNRESMGPGQVGKNSNISMKKTLLHRKL